jgi:hypothetical protein
MKLTAVDKMQDCHGNCKSGKTYLLNDCSGAFILILHFSQRGLCGEAGDLGFLFGFSTCKVINTCKAVFVGGLQESAGLE